MKIKERKALNKVIDVVAEWLRRQPAKLMGFTCMSSNLINVEFFIFYLYSKLLI